MAWNTPTDWDYKEAPGSSKLNLQVRDNLVYLKASLPPGVIMQYGGSVAPDQWLICDGSAISRSTYADLFSVIGTIYGVGDGSSTFNLPDGRGKVMVGYSSGDADFGTLGGDGGEKTCTLTTGEMPVHTHTQNAHSHGVTDPGHVHGTEAGVTHFYQYDASNTNETYDGNTTTGGNNRERKAENTGSAATGISINNATATNQNAGGGQAHNNLQPYLVINFIIKY